MFYKDRLRQLRIKHGLTQQELANMLGMDNTTISHYENGKRVPTIEILVALANTLHVNTNYLLGSDVTVISEHDSRPYFANLANQDLDIIHAIKANRKLYDYLLANPSRGIELLSKKL